MERSHLFDSWKRGAPWHGPWRGPWRALGLLLSFSLLVSCSDSPTDPNDDPTNGGPGAYNHGLAPGASARDFLAHEDFDRLIVEIQWVEGFAPDEAGLEHLESFLAARLHKPAGIEIQVSAEPLPIGGQATYSAADVRSIEQEHRTTYTEGTTLAAYFLFLDGEYAGSPNVLGIAYNNTSMALFAETIDNHTGGVFQPTRETVEATVAIHEFGHILGLVDNGTEMQTPHRDEDHGPHCDDEDCVMYYAVRTTDFLAQIFEGGIPELDENCLNDLRANGGR